MSILIKKQNIYSLRLTLGFVDYAIQTLANK